MDTVFQGYWDTGQQGHMDVVFQGYWTTGLLIYVDIKLHMDTGFQGCLAIWILDSRAIWMLGFRDT